VHCTYTLFAVNCLIAVFASPQLSSLLYVAGCLAGTRLLVQAISTLLYIGTVQLKGFL
jgi:hypothetical protein